MAITARALLNAVPRPACSGVMDSSISKHMITITCRRYVMVWFVFYSPKSETSIVLFRCSLWTCEYPKAAVIRLPLRYIAGREERLRPLKRYDGNKEKL
jgi:hypothetical protein